MSSSKEHSRGWPLLEACGPAQRYETPHSLSKKADSSYPHSWGWDSHVSPQWLQENLSEMNSKVTAMLKIIEEDADSALQRTEIFYERRPYLVSLVEEFYRTYRALVERHNFFAKERSQNIAPALQAHFTEASIHEPPADTLLKHGSDGFDISSLSPNSIPGALEYDDSHSEFSANFSKGQADNAWIPRPSFDVCGYEFQRFELGFEEEQACPQHLNRNHDVSESVTELMKVVQLLEEEKKALKAKSNEDEVKIKDLQSQVSILHSQTEGDQEQENGEINEQITHQATNMALQVEKPSRGIVTTRSRIQEQVEQGVQTNVQMSMLEKRSSEMEEYRGQLEAEKEETFNHVCTLVEQGVHKNVQMSMLEKRRSEMEESRDQFEAKKEETSNHVCMLEGEFKEIEKARNSLLAESQHYASQCKALEAAEVLLKEKLMSLANKNNSLEEDRMAVESLLANANLEVEELRGLLSAKSSEKASEEEMAKLKQTDNEHVALMAERNISSTDVPKQKDISEQEEREALIIHTGLEEKLSHLETENLERFKHVERLHADMEELEIAKDNAIAKCQLSEEECRALKASEEGLKALLESKLVEGLSLKKDKQALEDELIRVCRQMEEDNRGLEERLSRAVKKHVEVERAAMKSKDELIKELLELSALTEVLKQSLLARDMEISKLQDNIMKAADHQSQSEQRLRDEISHLQAEEIRWRNEVTINSALMAEKVATLRRENAALHEDLSVKLELLLKLQKDVKSLTEERSSLSEAIQVMAAEMHECKNDLDFFKEEVIPSLEERVGELQGEVTDLLMSNKRHVSKIETLGKEVADTNRELLFLHDENEKLKVELMFSVEMLKQVDAIFLTVKMETLKLGDKLGLLEQYCQKQGQNLVRVLDEKEHLNRGFLTITEERNALKAEVQRMMAMLDEVEQLQVELRTARQDDVLAEVAEYSDVGTVVSGDLGQIAKEGSIGELKTYPSHALLVRMLKEEILHLQLEIRRLQNKEVEARDFKAVASDDTPSPGKNLTSSSSSLSLEDVQVILADLQRLKKENSNLIEEMEFSKSQSLKAWMETKDLQATVASLHKQNGHLCSEVSSYKEDIARLEGECCSRQVKNGDLGLEVSSYKAHIERLGGEYRLLQEKNAELEGGLKSLLNERSELEETRCMLEGVITVLEGNNRRLQAETESDRAEIEKLCSTTFSMHDDASELIKRMKTKMMLVLEEVKLMIEECQGILGDEGIVQIMKSIELPFVSPSADKQHKIIQSIDHRDEQDALTELRSQTMFLLTELQARAEETSILLQFVVFIRKMLISILGGEHTCRGDAPHRPIDGILDGEVDGDFVEKTTPAYVEQHGISAEHLHQAFADEKLEHELLDLREERKHLKEELEMRSAEVQKMVIELEKIQLLLEQRERGKGQERLEGNEEEKRKCSRAEANAKELREMLAQQRRQIDRMREELMFGREQQEAIAENRVTVLVSMERLPSMEGRDEEHVNLPRQELESLRQISRRYFAELRTISQDLQSMGSIIKAARDQLLIGAYQGGEGEIEPMADLRTLNSNTLLDSRTQDNRVSVDSTQLLLSPFSPHITGQRDSLSAQQSSDGSTIGRFPLKHRNFGFTWFLLLFSPDRKATGALAGNKRNKPWMGRKPAHGSESSAVFVERGRRKTAGCWACVSNTGRIDSFDQR